MPKAGCYMNLLDLSSSPLQMEHKRLLISATEQAIIYCLPHITSTENDDNGKQIHQATVSKLLLR